jgi:hypothetical protein
VDRVAVTAALTAHQGGVPVRAHPLAIVACHVDLLTGDERLVQLAVRKWWSSRWMRAGRAVIWQPPVEDFLQGGRPACSSKFSSGVGGRCACEWPETRVTVAA